MALRPKRLTPDLEALAVKWANTFGAPPSLLLALMAIESSYNPRATNKSERAMVGGGAWGLSQLLLRDARDESKRFPDMARKYWPQWDGSGEGLLDPNTHLAIAAHKLARNWRVFRDWMTTGLSWHQGVAGTEKHVARGGGRVEPALLPPHGGEYWKRLDQQRTSNAVVAQALITERWTYT